MHHLIDLYLIHIHTVQKVFYVIRNEDVSKVKKNKHDSTEVKSHTPAPGKVTFVRQKQENHIKNKKGA